MAIKINDEPAYDNLKGTWISNGDFIVAHRVAVAPDFVGQRIGTKIFQLLESFAAERNIQSIKVDTNFDNQAMLKIMKRLNYQFCGYVYYRQSERLAFEKILTL